MRSSSLLSARLALTAVLPIALLLNACSSSAPTAAPSPAPASEAEAPDGPPYVLLHTDAEGLRLTNLHTDTSELLAPDASYGGARATSPDGRYVATALAWPDSTHLALVDLASGTTTALHRGAAATVYSPVWAADGDRLVFGHYVPNGEAMGPGGIATATVGGTVTDVGCSASKRALAALPDGPLLVADGRNHYVVAADGCRTLETLDARRLHEVTFSPDGRRMAYIRRELNYDRAARAYVPDSTLFIADVTGENAVEVAGDKYRPHNLAWSPDGRTLAFDVASQDHEGARSISLYDLDTGQATYLVPPAEAGTERDTRPVWSPDGRYLAFSREDVSTGVATPMVYSFEELLLRTIAIGRLQHPAATGWADPTTLIVRGTDGLVLAPVTSAQPITLPPHHALIHAAPSPAAVSNTP